MMQIIYKPPNLNCLCSRTANDALKLPNLECSTVYFVVVGESGPRSVETKELLLVQCASRVMLLLGRTPLHPAAQLGD